MSTDLVRQFTKDDFLYTQKPFDFLYDFKDKPFEMAQYREQMKEYAKAIGVLGFAGLWKAYLESKKGFGGQVYNATNFDGQELILDSGSYLCNDLGVTTSDRTGYEVVVCQHPIMPIQRLINIDNGEERLKIAYKKGWHWRKIIVEKSVLASSTSILQLANQGVMVNSENAKALSSYIFEMEQMNYDAIPEQKSVSRLGWVGEHGFSPYVEDLEFDGEQSFRHIFNSIHEKGGFAEWVDIMQKIRKHGVAGRLVLASSFASVLLEPLGLLSFFVHLWGSSEVGKSVSLMIAASVWGSCKMGDYIGTFNSTSVAQELQASFLNSLPMCMDELQIQASQGVKDFDKIIYMLAEGVGKARGQKTGGLQKLSSWRNCIITTGEFPITSSSSGGGAVNRIIEYECEEPVYSDLPKVCEIITKNYGFAGRIFVEWLQEEGNIEKVYERQKHYFRELLKNDSTSKQSASMSAILTADEIVTDLIFKDGLNLKINDVFKILAKKETVDANRRAYDYIVELVARNPNKFKRNDFGEYQGEVWGCKECDKIYIIKSVLERELKQEGFNVTAFLSWAKRNKMIEADENRTTVRKTINGSRVPCVCILTDKEDDQKSKFVELGQDEELPF